MQSQKLRNLDPKKSLRLIAEVDFTSINRLAGRTSLSRPNDAANLH